MAPTRSNFEVVRAIGRDLHRSQAEVPWVNAGGHEQTADRPRIQRQAIHNLRFARGAGDDERLPRALERSNQRGESLVEEGIHERRVLRPMRLALQRLRVFPNGPPRSQDHENTFHFYFLAVMMPRAAAPPTYMTSWKPASFKYLSISRTE